MLAEVYGAVTPTVETVKGISVLQELSVTCDMYFTVHTAVAAKATNEIGGKNSQCALGNTWWGSSSPTAGPMWWSLIAAVHG